MYGLCSCSAACLRVVHFRVLDQSRVTIYIFTADYIYIYGCIHDFLLYPCPYDRIWVLPRGVYRVLPRGVYRVLKSGHN